MVFLAESSEDVRSVDIHFVLAVSGLFIVKIANCVGPITKFGLAADCPVGRGRY